MDAFFPELTRLFDPTKPLGYLNFSDGRADVRFRKLLADVFEYLLNHADPAPWATTGAWLLSAADDLEQSGSAAFQDLSRAREVATIAFGELLVGYRDHHRDLLAHQPDAALFTAFFLARCCESAMAELAAGTFPLKIVPNCLLTLNDFVGYRPIAILETRPQTDFYLHEKVSAIPLYFRGVGVAPGVYSEVVRAALDLLNNTEPDLLEEACLDPERLDTLAIDPRATDHFHPVTKRPNVLFGEWDPHKIDGRGFYRRFVIRQGTLDALVNWATKGRTGPQRALDPERLIEASAVLAGTILMGAGISGTGPTHYDSNTTLTKLVGKIARFRDKFYEKLLEGLPGPHGVKLRAESAKLKQPFGGVRQSLNQAIAGERALHLQERRLAIFFSAMGYPTVARQRAAAIPAATTRLMAEIRIRQTAAQFAVRSGALAEVPLLLEEAEDTLKRGIECGAFVDPWNILGYQGLFPTFADRGDTVRDPRAEELILNVGRQFDGYAAALSAASAAQNTRLAQQLRQGMANLAEWWDQFATPTVNDLPKVYGAERAEAAEHVAQALSLWKSGGATDPSFWRKHREGFRTPSAYAQVIEALLDQGDYKAALALLVTWLSESEIVPLQDPSASFFRLAFAWLRAVLAADGIPVAERGPLIRRFFELLEANADDRWQVPELFGEYLDDDEEYDEDDDDEGDEGEDDDDDGETFDSAYEGMTYQDSTDDGNDSSLADDDPAGYGEGEFTLDGDVEPATERLRFLATVARLWQLAAKPELFPRGDTKSAELVSEWVRMARENFSRLVRLAQFIFEVEIPEPLGGVESLSEFDRRRGVKGQLLDATVQTAVETAAAVRSLAAIQARLPELPKESLGPTADIPAWEAVAIRLERHVANGDAGGVRRLLPMFIKLFGQEPLLVCPPSDGGTPTQAIRAQIAQQMMESLLTRLPRLGLLRETYHLTRLARQMERNEVPEGRRVSSFDVLFRTAVTGTVEAVLSAAREWGEDAGEDGPLAAALQQISESYQKLWLEHSQTLRLSSLEVVLDRDDWDDLREFITRYGSDLFTVRFVTLSNVRGVLAQGATDWLERESIQGDEDTRSKLLDDWEAGKLDKPKTAHLFEIVLNSLVEHYDEYRDYNTTTTQSDYGENLYILLDFLRLKAGYDRYAWRLRPLVLAHEVLCKRGYDRLAARWREFVAERTGRLAQELLTDLGKREAEHAIRLRTIRDRLEERFVMPLKIDQAAGRVARAAIAARDGLPEDNAAFAGLLAAIQPLAETPVGVGLDVPVWIRRLEEELRRVRFVESQDEDGEPQEELPQEDSAAPPNVRLDFDEFRRQIRDWDAPLGQ